MPTLKLTGRSKPAATRTAKPAAAAPKRRPRPTAAATPARKPTARKPAATRKPAPAQAETNGRSPKLPEGWTKGDFNRAIKEMEKANAAKVRAAEALAEAQAAVNQMALDMLSEGVQMSVVKDNLVLSRQWMYKLMEDAGMPTSGTRKKAAKKPAARKRPAAVKAPAKAPARKAPARKAPAARKRPPAASGRGRVVRLAA